MGAMYNRVKIVNGNGTFYTKNTSAEKDCKWTFQFSKNALIIKTIERQYDCGFGFEVYADGEFKKSRQKRPEYFKNGEGTKFYFKDTKPEEYNKP